MYLKTRPKLTGKITYKVEDKALAKYVLNAGDKGSGYKEENFIQTIRQKIDDFFNESIITVAVNEFTDMNKLVELYGADLCQAYGLDTDSDLKETVYCVYIPGVYFNLTTAKPVSFLPINKIDLDYTGGGDKLASCVGANKKMVDFGLKFEVFGLGEEGKYGEH